MALKQVLIDDIDGSEGATTRQFALGSVAYSTDLTDENYEKLQETLAPWIKGARRRGAKPKIKTVGTKTKITAPSASADLAAIRDWAKGKGMRVTDRGRIPRDIVDRFNAEHTNGAAKPEFSGIN